MQHLEEIVDTLFVIKTQGLHFNSIFMYLEFDNSVCTCLDKSNMDKLFLLQDCSIPVRPSSDLCVFFHSVFLLFMFLYILIKNYFCKSVFVY